MPTRHEGRVLNDLRGDTTRGDIPDRVQLGGVRDICSFVQRLKLVMF